jgi:hypothetical protein
MEYKQNKKIKKVKRKSALVSIVGEFPLPLWAKTSPQGERENSFFRMSGNAPSIALLILPIY